MPIINEGYRACEKCGKRFEWVCFEIRRSCLSDGIPVAETYPTGKALARRYMSENKTFYSVNCSHCDYENRFEEEC